MEKKEFLGTEPVGKLLFRLAIPTVVAQLINMLYNIVDRIYIGHMPEGGSAALTGVGVCLPIIMIVSAFACFFSTGGAPRASIALGKGETNTAEKILGGCLALQLAISVLLTVVLFVWNRELLLVFGASKQTIEYAVDYMNIYAMGTVFVQLTLGLNAFITAQGNTKTGMLTVTIGAVCNIILDPVFIFSCGMGVRGAALATIISQAVSCIWCICFLCGKKTVIRLRKKSIRFSIPIILPCVALGVSTFIMQSSESVIFVCFNSSLLKYGGDIAVGAMTICTTVTQFAMLPLQGISQGAQPISSYNFGAKNPGRVKKTFRLLLLSCFAYALLLWIAIMAAPQLFARMFTSDTELMDFSVHVIRIYCGALFLMGIQVACQMTFVSIGNAICSVIVAIVRKFILLLPLIYLMPAILSDKTNAVYMAEPIADVIAVSFTVILFTFQFRKAMKKLRE